LRVMRLYKIKTASEMKHGSTEFANEYTVRRRAWIAEALDSVRDRFTSGAEDDLHAPEKPPKPQLYVVKTDNVR